MTDTVWSTSKSYSAPNTAYATTADGDTLTVLPGVYAYDTVVGTGAYPFIYLGNSATVTNYGSLILAGNGYEEDVISSSANVTIKNNGLVAYQGSGPECDALFLGGDFSQVINEGQITSTSVGIFANASTLSTINNSGLIESDGGGAIYSTAGSVSLTNSGKIEGRLVLDANDHGTANVVLNQSSGIIDGTVSFGEGANKLTNNGTVDGDITLGSPYGKVGDTAINRGSIYGSITLGAGDDVITNTGKIMGDVHLGNGANTFNGKNGVVEGTIYGGTGVDNITGGNGGDVIVGGAGHDNLTAGRGGDNFIFSSFNDADSDLVHGFDVKTDTVELDHTVFTQLAAGQDPEFAVGSAAKGATDYLYFDKTTHGLYYDADGSGSGAAHLIATFDDVAKLKASDIVVI